MSKFKINNNQIYPIADLATPSAFTILSATASDIAPQLTRENLAKIQFLTDSGLVSGIYKDKQLVSCTQSGEDVAVVICDRYDIVLDIGPDNRVTGVRYPKFAEPGDTVVDNLPDGDPLDYKYVDGRFVYDPLPKPPEPEPEPPISEQLAALRNENHLLKEQVKSVADRGDFIEDCIAEMAMQVYA